MSAPAIWIELTDARPGFNAFLAVQRKLTGDCCITLVHFDGHDPPKKWSGSFQDSTLLGWFLGLSKLTYQYFARRSHRGQGDCALLLKISHHRIIAF